MTIDKNKMLQKIKIVFKIRDKLKYYLLVDPIWQHNHHPEFKASPGLILLYMHPVTIAKH